MYKRPKRRPKRHRAAALRGAPQASGSVYRLRIVTPKKPNSARRPAIKSFLNNGKNVVAHIPGQGHNLKRHSKVLVRGGGARDLPGVRHSCIRGVRDFLGSKNKTKRRSIYGVPRPDHLRTKVRRCLRRYT
jgi:small subunit ribosomal protein S12